jgi:hypothetical protein
MSVGTTAARSSAWAGLFEEQVTVAETPSGGDPARSPGPCSAARAEMAASFAAADLADPAPAWLREWVGCVDDILALAERLHAHVETLPTG